MNQKMSDTLLAAQAQAVKEAALIQAQTGRIEQGMLDWMRTRLGIELPDEVEASAQVYPLHPGKSLVVVHIYPRPDQRLFSVSLLNPVHLVKGRLFIQGQVYAWRGHHGPIHKSFDSFEAAVRYALTGK